MASLGWIGFGEIGLPMALRLIGAGHEVVVWNRSAARLQPALDAGATAAASPADVAVRCEATFVCVTDGDAVEEIVFGERGIAEGASAGTLVVDHSTIHPDETRGFAEQLTEIGAGWVDAPVSGGPGGARAGTLASFLGGSDGDVARVMPWIAAYVAKATHLGPVGSGQIAKSCNQAVVASTIAIWAEIIGYARACGIDPETLVDAVEGGWADSPLRRDFATAMARGAERTDRRTLILKDLEIVSDMAGSVRAPVPLTGLVTSLFRMALARDPEIAGMTAIAGLYER
ncbi:oxidoreductase [Vulcanimicrobium alpinum]|uniref:Oxidoreductase n=1 Tax=Vulcanimicrobium alpinum TaxID=3016050 RepID=A0AAN1XYX2_UNVUL|nr:NAD(P)-dependent oxidoreductase [Vulcanimicrobium alpinum]BDE07924.1 oxidoreductase [Vulcanimicrobium alpinum]